MSRLGLMCSSIGIGLLLVLLTPSSGQSNPTAEQVMALENLASRPGAHISASGVEERVSGAKATAFIVAVQVSAEGRIQRGVRIRFESLGRKDVVYIPEHFVDNLLTAMEEIEERAPGVLARKAANTSCFGTGAFLHAMRQGAHFFHPSWRYMADGWRGLSVTTGTETFRFEDISPAPFHAAITRAKSTFPKAAA